MIARSSVVYVLPFIRRAFQDVMQGFTRQEVLALTGCTSNRLQYLDRIGLVVPQRYGSFKKPVVIYAWEQVIEIRSLDYLKGKISVSTVKKIFDFLNKSTFDNELRDKKIVFLNDKPFWVSEDWSDMSHLMQSIEENNQEFKDLSLVVIPSLVNIVNEIWQEAKNSKSIDFESFRARAKAQPYQLNNSTGG